MDEAWLDLVRVARDAGDISSLLPPGVKSLYDAPSTFVADVRMALIFLSFEELPKVERPPRNIWLDREKMDAWWRQVEEHRKGRTDGHGDLANMSENLALKEAFAGVTFRS